jgi:hypothetical protein
MLALTCTDAREVEFMRLIGRMRFLNSSQIKNTAGSMVALAKARIKPSICWGLDKVSRSRRNSGGREADVSRRTHLRSS